MSSVPILILLGERTGLANLEITLLVIGLIALVIGGAIAAALGSILVLRADSKIGENKESGFSVDKKSTPKKMNGSLFSTL